MTEPSRPTFRQRDCCPRFEHEPHADDCQLAQLDATELEPAEPTELELFATSHELFGTRRGWNR